MTSARRLALLSPEYRRELLASAIYLWEQHCMGAGPPPDEPDCVAAAGGSAAAFGAHASSSGARGGADGADGADGAGGRRGRHNISLHMSLTGRTSFYINISNARTPYWNCLLHLALAFAFHRQSQAL